MNQKIKNFVLDAYQNSLNEKYEFGNPKYKELLPYYEEGNSVKECCLNAREILKIPFDSGSFSKIIKQNGLIVRGTHEQNQNALARKTKLINRKTGEILHFDGQHQCADYLQKVLNEPNRKLVKDGMDKCLASSEKKHSRQQYRGYYVEFESERKEKPISVKEGLILRLLLTNENGTNNKLLNNIQSELLEKTKLKYQVAEEDFYLNN